MEKYYIMSPTLDRIYGLNKKEIDKQIADANQKIEQERKKAATERKKAATERKKAATERKKAATERKKAVEKLLLSGFFSADEIADIMAMPVEDIEKIKTEIDTKN